MSGKQKHRHQGFEITLMAFLLGEIQHHPSTYSTRLRLGLSQAPRALQPCGIEGSGFPGTWHYQGLGEISQKAYLIAMHMGRIVCFVFRCYRFQPCRTAGQAMV